MDGGIRERVRGEAMGIDGSGHTGKAPTTSRQLPLKIVNRRTGMIRRRRVRNAFAKHFPIVSTTGFFLSDRRVILERRSKSVDGFRPFKPL
jgi:hypothetical protein